MPSRDSALGRDAADPLARFRDEFVIDDPELIYLDGNSLGRLTHRARAAIETATTQEWGDGLVRSWHDWMGISESAGNSLAPLIGAEPGEVILCDQTSVNLYKLTWAALAYTGRPVAVGDDSNFPSDRYVLRSVAEARDGSYREAEVDPVAGPTVEDFDALVDSDVGVVSLSLVSFKSGAIADMHAITELAHRHGALVLWDLSHAAGAIPVELGAAGADLAVGCTYKYLNGGPGSPAFLYVRSELQSKLEQPIPGWFGHDDMFAFEGRYRPAAGIRRFAIGTPPVLSLRGAEAGISITAEAGMAALREKSLALTGLLIELYDERLASLGFGLATPRDATRRGSHVSISHPQGYGITRALIENGVVPDFRKPDSIRLGVAPLYNRFVEMHDAVDRLVGIVERGEHQRFGEQAHGEVT